MSIFRVLIAFLATVCLFWQSNRAWSALEMKHEEGRAHASNLLVPIFGREIVKTFAEIPALGNVVFYSCIATPVLFYVTCLGSLLFSERRIPFTILFILIVMIAIPVFYSSAAGNHDKSWRPAAVAGLTCLAYYFDLPSKVKTKNDKH